MFTYAVEVTRVVDGDTIDVDIDLGFDTWVRDVRLRLSRIDAYETRLGKKTTPEDKIKGLKAKEVVTNLVNSHPKSIQITTTKRGKFGRWIAEVTVKGVNVSDLLVKQNLAIYKNY